MNVDWFLFPDSSEPQQAFKDGCEHRAGEGGQRGIHGLAQKNQCGSRPGKRLLRVKP